MFWLPYGKFNRSQLIADEPFVPKSTSDVPRFPIRDSQLISIIFNFKGHFVQTVNTFLQTMQTPSARVCAKLVSGFDKLSQQTICQTKKTTDLGYVY